MKNTQLSRRQLIKNSAAIAGAALVPGILTAQSGSETTNPKAAQNFRYCLNTSTIRGQRIGFVEEIELAAKVGYDGIEIWIGPLEQYAREGGSLKDLKKRIDDLGIQVENAIGFAQWIVDDNDQRTAALEQAKREMDLLAQVGCSRIAAPPAGATQYPGLDLDKAAERFRALVEIGVAMGVIPQLEIWGFAKNLYRLSQVVYVAAECGHPQTRILPDVYHLHKGGSDFDGLKLLSPAAVEIFHMNDYPNDPDRATIQDKDRVYPGDGVAPVSDVIQTLSQGETPTILSLELFNRDYWKQDAETVVRTGLEKMKMAVEKAKK